MKERRLISNVWKIYVIRGIRSFMLFIPVIVLFFKENGLSMKEIFILEAAFSIATIFIEIPSGYFSDIFGKKISIVIGVFMATIGYVAYSISWGFWSFLLSELILGIGASFISGSDSALLYDTLLAERAEMEYKKVEGKKLSVATFSEGVASIMGGFLALISLRFPLYAEVIISFLAIPVALTLTEPKVKNY